MPDVVEQKISGRVSGFTRIKVLGVSLPRSFRVSPVNSRQVYLDPILRLRNLQLQRQLCNRLVRFLGKIKHFSFQNALGYSWRCKKLPRNLWHSTFLEINPLILNTLAVSVVKSFILLTVITEPFRPFDAIFNTLRGVHTKMNLFSQDQN
jgi:hypothetical protein